LKKAPYLVFATSYDQYALKAFQMNAKDYILQPFEEEKITQVIEKLSKEMAQDVPENSAEKEPKSLAIPIQGEGRIYLV
ncbi:DNA-binding response regulator, partial [Enterococcus faecalis]